MKHIGYFLLIIAMLASCKESTKSVGDAAKDAATKTADKMIETMGGNSIGNGMTIKPFTESVAFPDASISSVNYTNGVFTFGVRGDKYKLGKQSTDAPAKMCANSAKGQHIHLIMNDSPYAAKYVNQFEHDVPDGDHHMLAFLSRSYHESIKSNGASVALKVNVENKSIVKTEQIKEPMLFYSRPKGNYVGNDTKNLMLDFFLTNVNLSADGYKVKADINGTETIITDWQPYYLNGLPMGENTITLTLIDKDNKKVDTPLNPVSRTFTLKADPMG